MIGQKTNFISTLFQKLQNPSAKHINYVQLFKYTCAHIIRSSIYIPGVTSIISYSLPILLLKYIMKQCKEKMKLRFILIKQSLIELKVVYGRGKHIPLRATKVKCKWPKNKILNQSADKTCGLGYQLPLMSKHKYLRKSNEKYGEGWSRTKYPLGFEVHEQ